MQRKLFTIFTPILDRAVNPVYLTFKIYILIEVKYITVKEYSEKHGMNLKTVYNHISSGKIPKERIKKVLSTTLIKV